MVPVHFIEFASTKGTRWGAPNAVVRPGIDFVKRLVGAIYHSKQKGNEALLE